MTDIFKTEQHLALHTADGVYRGTALVWSLSRDETAANAKVHLDTYQRKSDDDDDDSETLLNVAVMTPSEALELASGLFAAATRALAATALSVEAEIAAEAGFYGE